jgi:tRNA nucleotidyltransferase (CCA-adding enzyme)
MGAEFGRLDALDLAEATGAADATGSAGGADPESEATVACDAVLVTAASFWHAGVGADAAAAAVQRLRFSNRDIARVRAVVAALADPLPAPAQTRDVRRWLAHHRAIARDVIAVSEPRVRRPDILAAVLAVETAGDALSLRELAVTGEDLKAAGVAAGKGMGDVLRRLLDEVLDEPRLNTRDELLRRARELST